jgi:nicotinamide-nucleotide amidase
MTSAAILSTGEEVLRGEIDDTNATFIARSLQEHGIVVNLRLTVGDRFDDLLWAIQEALRHADLLIMTGGLGPTEDDLTAKVVAAFAGVDLEFHEAIWQTLKNRFAHFNIAVTDNNKRQAFFPKSARILPNPHGTAAGFAVKVNGKTIVALPGPPREMQPMLEAYLQQLAPSFNKPFYLRFVGLGESQLSAAFESFGEDLKRLSFRTAYPEVVVKTYENDSQFQKRLLAFAIQQLSDYFLDAEDTPVPILFSQFAVENNLLFTVAESCTGGLVGKMVTDVSGSSSFFLGSLVTYANPIKEKVLGVEKHLLDHYGAVSAEVAQAMAKGASDVMGANLSLAITGIAGPEGGSAEKPVGTVWMAKQHHHMVQTRLFHFLPRRDFVRAAAAACGLRWLMEDWLHERWQKKLASLVT